MRNTIDPAGWWSLTPGLRNSITDIAGVRVGHCSLLDSTARTGVTAIIPHGGDLYQTPVTAAAEIHNGFGKSTGLVQLQELGQIETPILLTNTFGVPACAQALIRSAIAGNPQIGRKKSTVNPLVLECNDGRVNDIQALHVTEDAAMNAITAASEEVQQGAIGAGTGMLTFGYAGGIGTASRIAGKYRLAALVLSNFGSMAEMRVMGRRINPANVVHNADNGSIIVVIATDAPVDSRQLGRICRRVPAALGRLGSYMGHGSGDISVAFTTMRDVDRIMPDAKLDQLFLATVESVEEAVLNAVWHGQARRGYDGYTPPEFRQDYESFNAPGNNTDALLKGRP